MLGLDLLSLSCILCIFCWTAFIEIYNTFLDQFPVCFSVRKTHLYTVILHSRKLWYLRFDVWLQKNKYIKLSCQNIKNQKNPETVEKNGHVYMLQRAKHHSEERLLYWCRKLASWTSPQSTWMHQQTRSFPKCSTSLMPYQMILGQDDKD